MSEFGEALARYRKEAGLNQRELGAAIDLDSTQVNKIERGHRPPPGAKYMKPLVRVLRLNQNEALNLVRLAGHSPKVLEDEVEAPVHPRILRKKATVGAFGAGVGLGSILRASRTGRRTTERASQQRDQNIGLLIEQTLTEAQLTSERKMLAGSLILENARLVCQILVKEQDWQRK